MLLPSLLLIAQPSLTDLLRHWEQRDQGSVIIMIGILIGSLPFFAFVLCFVLGFLLEKWRRGEVESPVRAIGYGILIFFTNGVVAFIGCTVTGNMKLG